MLYIVFCAIVVFLVALEIYFRRVPYERVTPLDESAHRHKLRSNADPGFPAGWFRLASLHEVPRGKLIRRALCGRDYLVVRTSDDRLSVFHPYCPHNGTDLSRNGRIRGDRIVCPFHEWEFSCDTGTCTKIPYGTNNEATMRISALTSPHIRMWYDSVLVWYHPEGREPLWEPQEDKPIPGTMRRIGRISHTLSCLVDDIHENSSDLAHFMFLHGKHPIPLINNEWTGYSWRPEEHVGNGTIANGIRCGRKELVRFETRWHNHGPGIITIETDATMLGRFVLIDTTTPRDVFVTERNIEIYYSSRAPGIFRRLSCSYLYHVTLQDNAIWNWKLAIKRPRYTKDERDLAAFRRWFRNFYVSKAPVTAPDPATSRDHVVRPAEQTSQRSIAP